VYERAAAASAIGSQVDLEVSARKHIGLEDSFIHPAEMTVRANSEPRMTVDTALV
jgi:hypothetical protein